jgi:ATP-dependent exoDNAse (exonuclease V) beta subunit
MFNHVKIEIPEAKTINTPRGRMYETPDGATYPSVTTMLSFKSKDSIAAWRAKIGEEEANRISTQASSRGTKIHNHCEKVLLNEEIDTSDLNLFDRDMWNKFRPLLDNISNIHALETALYSHHLRLAGRVDCIAEYEGKLSVIDFKTSAKPKYKKWIDGYFMQCSAYAIMFEERTGISVPRTVVLIAVEGSEPQVFKEKRDNYAEQLLDLRLEYERHNKMEG